MGEMFKEYFNILMFHKYNKIYVCHLNIHKHVFYKNYINTTSIQDNHKTFPKIWGKFLKRILPFLYFLIYNEIIQCHAKACFL